jgi:hypothetical protein
MFSEKKKAAQAEFWVATHQLAQTGMTLFTAFEPFMGTPAYTSPEQACRLGSLC